MKRNWFISSILVGSLVLGTFQGAWAKDKAEEKTSASDDSGSTPLSSDELEAINKAVADKLAASQGLAPVKVGANLQFLYSHASNGKQSNGLYSSSKNQWDSFSFKRAEVFLSSTAAGDTPILWAMSFDFAQPSFNGLGDTSGTLFSYGAPVTVAGATTVTSAAINPFTLVKDMWGKISFADAFVFFAGQNKFPQGLEGRTPTFDLDFNNYANVTTYFGNKRDIGVQIMGSKIALGPAILEYALDVIQGAGQSTYDNNVDKDFAARLGLTLDPFFLGTSGYDGWEPNGARFDWGLEGRWVSGPLRIQAEYILGQVNPADNAAQNNSVWTPIPKGNFQANPQGYYLMANYRYKGLRFGARWDGYNADQWTGSAFNNEMDTATVGVDWFTAKDACKLSLNWEDHYTDGLEQFNLWTVQAQFHI